jgi:hypothetical protein
MAVVHQGIGYNVQDSGYSIVGTKSPWHRRSGLQQSEISLETEF